MGGWTTNRLDAVQHRRGGAAARASDHPLGSGGSPAPRTGASPHLSSAEASAELGAARGSTLADPQALLSRLVEQEIIPRLMLMHRTPQAVRSQTRPPLVLSDEHVCRLAELAVHGTPECASLYVASLLDQGASHEQIFLDLLAPSARWMGQQWESDAYDFSQVTIGLWRLQRALHEQSTALARLRLPGGTGRNALLAAVPGAQHTFGVAMVAEFFGRAGWDVECEPKATWSGLRSRLADSRFDLLGLSVSTSDSVEPLASAILDLRKAAGNPRLFVMLGGPMAAQIPDLARLCGADAVATDARQAVIAAEEFIGRRLRQV